MKMHVTSQHLSFFRQHGEILFENFPLEIKSFPSVDSRDNWRHQPELKKWIISKIGPLALEITGKAKLFLACDQWVSHPWAEKPIQDFFCFQGLVLICAFYKEEKQLHFLEPSHLTSKLKTPCLLIAFGLDSTRLIANPNDPFATQTRNLGYVYGDLLNPLHHPILFK